MLTDVTTLASECTEKTGTLSSAYGEAIYVDTDTPDCEVCPTESATEFSC